MYMVVHSWCPWHWKECTRTIYKEIKRTLKMGGGMFVTYFVFYVLCCPVTVTI
jgi:hypothetical protein